MLLPVCLPACLPRCLAASLPRGMSWQEASKCILQQQQQEQSAQTLPLFSPSSAQSHTCIQYAYSLVWSGSVNRRHPRTVSQSEETSPPSPPTLFCHSAPPACIFFLSTCQSVFIIIAAISVSCAASICQLVSLSVRLSVCLYFYLASLSLPLPLPPSFYSSQCSAFKLQPIVIAAFVLPSESFVQVMQPFFQLINLFSYICCLPPIPAPPCVPLSFFYLPARLLSMSTGAAATAAAAFVCSRSASLGLMNN